MGKRWDIIKDRFGRGDTGKLVMPENYEDYYEKDVDRFCAMGKEWDQLLRIPAKQIFTYFDDREGVYVLTQKGENMLFEKLSDEDINIDKNVNIYPKNAMCHIPHIREGKTVGGQFTLPGFGKNGECVDITEALRGYLYGDIRKFNPSVELIAKILNAVNLSDVKRKPFIAEVLTSSIPKWADQFSRRMDVGVYLLDEERTPDRIMINVAPEELAVPCCFDLKNYTKTGKWTIGTKQYVEGSTCVEYELVGKEQFMAQDENCQ